MDITYKQRSELRSWRRIFLVWNLSIAAIFFGVWILGIIQAGGRYLYEILPYLLGVLAVYVLIPLWCTAITLTTKSTCWWGIFRKLPFLLYGIIHLTPISALVLVALLSNDTTGLLNEYYPVVLCILMLQAFMFLNIIFAYRMFRASSYQ